VTVPVSTPAAPAPADESARKHYDFTAVEARWQRYWLDHATFAATLDPAKPKAYVLDMFPYPSGAGLHVGHPEGYTATDIYCRYLRAKGWNVLHPMGWDAFGLPAEQYAIQTGTHPSETTQRNVRTFKRQIQALGFSYDWAREVDTTDPGYYRWTQWIFLRLFERGLAYQAEVPVNWCPALGTVLANEEVVDGKSERGGHPVTRMPMRQWMLRITAYAERLLEGVDRLDWPEGIKAMQRNWIGRSEGAEVDFTVQLADGTSEKLRIYTTRPDTLYGATYMVVAPEHPLVAKLTTDGQRAAVEAYVAAAVGKSERDRQDELKPKTGVATGAMATNPLNGQPIPVWLADYVLWGYGTGAIMAVPAHDERDFAFAKTYGLPIVPVLSPDGQAFQEVLTEAYTADGTSLANCGPFRGLQTAEFKTRVTAWLAERGLGAAKVNWKLRDWVFSRQRYWGEPIPIFYPVVRNGSALVNANFTTQGVWNLVQTGSAAIDYDQPHAVSDADLPLKLPDVSDFQPTGDAEPPLSRAVKWRFFQRDGAWFARETNTMPQWAGSCWYYLRYLDPKNEREIASPAAIGYWLPVDLYVGGAEHAVLHLLYARFWHKVLHDCGVVPQDEPFQRLVNQGMILGEDGEKMSKSCGNVVNPDAMIKDFGADAFRLCEMFMGPLEAVKPWSTQGMHGMRRFLNRVHALYDKPLADAEPDADTLRLCHKLIQKVGDDTANLRFNTALAAMMAALNDLVKLPELPRKVADLFAVLLAPYAPHLAEELWHARLGHAPSVGSVAWPDFDPELAKDDTIEVPVQVNGKLRGKVLVARDVEPKVLESLALAEPGVLRHTEGKQIRKVIVVPGRMVSVIAS
jgi:leucyl-tRNA synthetase